MQIGIIGGDSSHVAEFSRRINTLNEAGKTGCRVTWLWDPRGEPSGSGLGTPAAPAGSTAWLDEAVRCGVVPVAELDAMLGMVDGVMVLTREGHRHLEFASKALGRGLPTFVDKPLTCSLKEARSLLERARRGPSGARCFSTSSLRFAAEIPEIPRSRLGSIVAIDAFGGGETLPTMPGLWYYGCHTIELVDAIWGSGVGRVRVLESPDRHLVDLEYRDGRCARLRLERRGAGVFGATVHGERGVHQFVVEFASIYARFVEQLVRFFEGGIAPVDLRDIVETVAVMESGEASAARRGEWFAVEDVPGDDFALGMRD